MQVVNTASIVKPEGKTDRLALFKVERGCFRWRTQAGEVHPGLEADFLDASDAVRAIRVLVDGDPRFVGSDLTVHPVAPPPEERAAKAIWKAGDDLSVDEIAEIIRKETAIDRLVENISLLVAYELPRLRMPKPAGLDLIQGGLLLNVIEAMERAQATDYSNLKSILKKPVEKVQLYSNLPPTGSKPS